MTYNPNIPNANDLLSDSQGDIKLNFQQANVVFDANHYTFNAAANKGKHKFISLPVLANYAAIVPAPVSGEGTIYTKTAGSARNIFYTPGASTNEFQITNCRATGDFPTFGTLTDSNPGDNNFRGWTFLPGGLLLQYGRRDTTSLTFNFTFPITFTTIYSVNVTQEKAGATTPTRLSLFNVGTGGASVNVDQSGESYYWTAIGLKS